MQETKQNPTFWETSRFSWFASLTIFSLTILAIWGLYAYQYVMTSSISELTAEIAQLEDNIHTASNDKDVIVANILSSTTIRSSVNLKTLVSSFRSAANAAWVRLSGFAVQDDIITSSLIATQDAIGKDPVETIIAMMRANTTTSWLSLEPISSIQWTSTERTTWVSFRILSSNLTTNVTK